MEPYNLRHKAECRLRGCFTFGVCMIAEGSDLLPYVLQKCPRSVLI
jgi:hypothetical protein